jgi:hypothetical protein
MQRILAHTHFNLPPLQPPVGKHRTPTTLKQPQYAASVVILITLSNNRSTTSGRQARPFDLPPPGLSSTGAGLYSNTVLQL